MNDFIVNDKKDLNEILLDTPAERLKLISGGSELVGVANLQYGKKTKLLKHILQLPADFIIVDLGAGQSFNTLDFFNLSSAGIIVSNPEPTARLDAYSFLKSVVYRKILTSFKTGSEEYLYLKKVLIDDRNRAFQLPKLPMIMGQTFPEASAKIASILQSFKPRLIMNKVRKRSHVDDGLQLTNLAAEYLGMKLAFMGYIVRDQKVVEASEKMMPFLLQYPRCKASQNIYRFLDEISSVNGNGRLFRHFYQFKNEMKSQSKAWK